MSKINNINYGYSAQNYQTRNNKNVSFSGTNYWARKDAEKVLAKYLPPQVKIFQFFQKNQSEVMNILVNAVGTSIVAPIMISNNPISSVKDKNDKDALADEKSTRKYSALRQPVSAVLAVGTQAGIVIPFNKLIDNLANNGELGFIDDLRIRQSNSYLKSQAKKKLEKENPDFKKLPKAEREEQIKKEVVKEAKKQYKKSIKLVKEHGTIVIEDANGKLIKMPKEDFYNLMEETAKDFKKNYLDSSLKDYSDKRIPRQFKRAKYLKDNSEKVEKTIKQAINLLDDESVQQRSYFGEMSHSIKASIAKKRNKTLEEPEFVNPPFKKLIKQLKKEKADPELVQILEEAQSILKRDAIKLKLNKTMDHVNLFTNKTKAYDPINIEQEIKFNTDADILDYVSKKANKDYKVTEEIAKTWEDVIKDISDAKKDIGSKTEDECAAIFNAIKQKAGQLKGTAVKNGVIDADGYNANFYSKVVEKHIDNVTKRVKNYKDKTGLIMSLAMVPITCGALNWIYPRFMEKFFPELCKSKKGGNK